MRLAPAYVSISLVFFILIGMGFAYSYFFYPFDHPIDCMYSKITGKVCPTCGLSRSFSFFTHFKFQEGKSYNDNALFIFLFFLLQFVWRGFVMLSFFTARKSFSSPVIKTDVIISISMFLLAFLPVILKL